MKQTYEVRRLPISRGMRIGAVLFSTALLSAGFFMLDVTWLTFAYSLACAAGLLVLWLARDRGQPPLMSEGTQKTTRLHVERGGEPVTIEMVGTPKYPRPVLGDRPRIAVIVFVAVWLLLPDEWTSSAVDALGNLVWPLLGPLLSLFVASIYILLRAPEESSPVLSDGGKSRN